jgi:hypothetical protein
VNFLRLVACRIERIKSEWSCIVKNKTLLIEKVKGQWHWGSCPGCKATRPVFCSFDTHQPCSFQKILELAAPAEKVPGLCSHVTSLSWQIQSDHDQLTHHAILVLCIALCPSTRCLPHVLAPQIWRTPGNWMSHSPSAPHHWA